MVALEVLPAGAKYVDHRGGCPHTQCPSQYGEALEQPEITEGLSYWTAGRATVSSGRYRALSSEEIYPDNHKGWLGMTAFVAFPSIRLSPSKGRYQVH